MAILIANIGTSDLTVRFDIEGTPYYFPIEVRQEPGWQEQLQQLAPPQQAIWQQARSHLTQLYVELGGDLTVEPTRRELTRLLLARYRHDPTTWHPRLKPVRIWGTVNKALEANLRRLYIFVTDQRTPETPQGQKQDTIYLYFILKKWFRHEGFNLKIKRVMLPSDRPAHLLEPMLDAYERGIAQISAAEKAKSFEERDRLAFVSVRGGTTSMAIALQLQAMNSSLERVVFLEPQLSYTKVLTGQPSLCQLTVYWQHLQSQKVQIVARLLDRWDFDGAAQVLANWQEALLSLPSGLTAPRSLEQHREQVAAAIAALELGSSFLNLDRRGAREILKTRPDLGELTALERDYQPWLNLYTLCRIYWQLNQMANFLARLSSLWEEVLNVAIARLDGGRYFSGDLERWQLERNRVEPQLWNHFFRRESQKNTHFKNWDFAAQPYPLTSRFSKQRFVEALVRERHKDGTHWQSLKQALSQVNYWVNQRNNLIHRAEGVSQQTMSDLLEDDRKAGHTEALRACDRDAILEEITRICCCLLQLLDCSANPFLGTAPHTPYAIYSQLSEWVLERLNFEF